MANETIEMNGTSVQFVDPSVEQMGIVPVDYDEEEENEITTTEMIVGTGLTMAVGVGLWELGKFIWRKAIGPLCCKGADKFREQQAKKQAEKDKKNEAEKAENNSEETGENPATEEEKKALKEHFEGNKKHK